MDYRNITVAGSGVLGSQIAFQTAYIITLAKAGENPEFEKLAYLLKTEYLNKGRHGKTAGQGFYSYPNPNFASPDFLRNQ